MPKLIYVRANKADATIDLLFADPVGTPSAPAVVVGKLRAPVEIMDPRTGQPRVTDEGTPDPRMVDVRTQTVAGLSTVTVCDDVVEVVIDGETVWTAKT